MRPDDKEKSTRGTPKESIRKDDARAVAFVNKRLVRKRAALGKTGLHISNKSSRPNEVTTEKGTRGLARKIVFPKNKSSNTTVINLVKADDAGEEKGNTY